MNANDTLMIRRSSECSNQKNFSSWNFVAIVGLRSKGSYSSRSPDQQPELPAYAFE